MTDKSSVLLELSNVASIADSLLNFEDSITKQMEAEVLLGRELNLEKAREMVFNNDIAGAMQEISQLVSPEEFNAMDAVRREALAAATGLDAAALSSYETSSYQRRSSMKGFSESEIFER